MTAKFDLSASAALVAAPFIRAEAQASKIVLAQAKAWASNNVTGDALAEALVVAFGVKRASHMPRAVRNGLEAYRRIEGNNALAQLAGGAKLFTLAQSLPAIQSGKARKDARKGAKAAPVAKGKQKAAPAPVTMSLADMAKAMTAVLKRANVKAIGGAQTELDGLRAAIVAAAAKLEAAANAGQRKAA